MRKSDRRLAISSQQKLALIALMATSLRARADLALETETARLLEPGHYAFGAAGEYQISPDGKEYAVPMAFEFGVLHRLEMLLEPVPMVTINPNDGAGVTGAGDLETTLTYLMADEQQYRPALAIAGEIKWPTAGQSLIGTDEWDYRFYLVASKRLGNVGVHANLGYNIIGATPEVQTQNPIDAELAGEWFVSPRFDLLSEITYVGSSAAFATGHENPTPIPTTPADVAPEVSGEEIVGTAGVRFHLTPAFDVFTTFSYDNNQAKLFRAGFNVTF